MAAEYGAGAIGVSMTALGGFLAVAASRNRVFNLSIEKGVVAPERGLVTGVTAMISLVGMPMLVYMLLKAHQAMNGRPFKRGDLTMKSGTDEQARPHQGRIPGTAARRHPQ